MSNDRPQPENEPNRLEPSRLEPSRFEPSRFEPSHLPYGKAPPYHTIQTKIGQELRARYEPPQELPHRMLALLMQINEQHEQE